MKFTFKIPKTLDINWPEKERDRGRVGEREREWERELESMDKVFA